MTTPSDYQLERWREQAANVASMTPRGPREMPWADLAHRAVPELIGAVVALDHVRSLIERAYSSGDISQGMRDCFHAALNGTSGDDDLYADTDAHLPPRDADGWQPIEVDLREGRRDVWKK